MSEAWIIDACRTPRGIGKKGKGALGHLHPQHLGATVLRAVAARAGLAPEDIDLFEINEAFPWSRRSSSATCSSIATG